MKLNKYKLRAECQDDVARFISYFTDYINSFECALQDYRLPDVDFIFTSVLELKQIQNILCSLDDCHVMAQTVQLFDNYTGERDYTIIMIKSEEEKTMKQLKPTPNKHLICRFNELISVGDEFCYDYNKPPERPHPHLYTLKKAPYYKGQDVFIQVEDWDEELPLEIGNWKTV